MTSSFPGCRKRNLSQGLEFLQAKTFGELELKKEEQDLKRLMLETEQRKIDLAEKQLEFEKEKLELERLKFHEEARLASRKQNVEEEQARQQGALIAQQAELIKMFAMRLLPDERQ